MVLPFLCLYSVQERMQNKSTKSLIENIAKASWVLGPENREFLKDDQAEGVKKILEAARAELKRREREQAEIDRRKEVFGW